MLVLRRNGKWKKINKEYIVDKEGKKKRKGRKWVGVRKVLGEALWWLKGGQEGREKLVGIKEEG